MQEHRQSWQQFEYVFINTLGLRQNGRHFADNIFKCIFLNENVWISIKISLEFVPKGPINNIPALVQMMVWCCPGNKPSSEPMMFSLPTYICVIRPQWVKVINNYINLLLAGWQYSILLMIFKKTFHAPSCVNLILNKCGSGQISQIISHVNPPTAQF